jgi:hypothetical protein
MGRRKTKDDNPPWVSVFWDILNSATYRDLNHAAGKCLPYFLGKVKIKNYNNAERYEEVFKFSYAEAKRYGFAPGTFFKIIQELISKGFIDPEEKGGLKSGWTNKDEKNNATRGSNHFKLSKRWQKYGQPDFESLDWKQFFPKPRQKKIKATPKMEIYSSKNGNNEGSESEVISKIGVVGGTLG